MPILTDAEIVEWVMSAKPVPFEIDGHEFSLRQMKPAERDRLNYVEKKTRDKVMADYRADGLDKLPVSDELTEGIRIYNEALEYAYQQASASGDVEATKQAALDMEQPLAWPTDLAHERANEEVNRASARWMVDNLLDGDRGAFDRLTAPDPLNHDAVLEALATLRKRSTHDPNFNGRRQSVPQS
jgi:hypothetical protein